MIDCELDSGEQVLFGTGPIDDITDDLYVPLFNGQKHDMMIWNMITSII